MKIERIFKAKYPSGIFTMVFMLILIGTNSRLYLVERTNRDNFDVFMSYFGIFLLVCFFAILIFTIIRMFMNPFTMQISRESLKVKNRELKPSDIKEIRVQGDIKSLIGITPIGKIITPIHFCFRFIEQEDEAIRELTEWASKHKVRLLHKQVNKWL
ncbi:MAG: hypothetical protein ACQEXX_21900 [Bacillota bacterium]